MTQDRKLSEAGRNLLFLAARSQNGWLDKPVDEALLREAFDIARMGPTSANCSPMRVIFVRTREGKARLRPALSSGNSNKTMAAPVTAILGYDLEFYEQFSFLFPHDDAKSWFTGNQAVTEATAFRNGSLQGAYFMLACRAVGLDCGPMSGFDNDIVDKAFFAGTAIRSNFLCNVGYGDPAALYGRLPRFDFDDVCSFA